MTYSFHRWRDDGLDAEICELLRTRVRECAGRTEDPSLVVLDAQSVHAASQELVVNLSWWWSVRCCCR
ncbi:hypothetical protein [Streptomyces antimycoticus]|uniref:hypothetical protein n=1 Tax=Streptomyces antimycoticus TaxID=68175 RepID=UPI0025711EDD|nr:hypothetical protein [Streptomyces antimycoticus]WJE00760.1 hypothetical protein QR300_35005 [Streptomyces antimycoticus]